MFKIILYMSLSVLLMSCAPKHKSNFQVYLGFSSPFEAAQNDFHQGRVLEARTRLLAIKKGEADYEEAQAYFKNTVEPARLKLLRYYARKGKAEREKGEWAKSEEAYRMAIELSQQPDVLKKYKKEMNLRARQLRLDSLYVQRKKEDESWLDWQHAYSPPVGLLPNDEVFSLAKDDLEQSLSERVDDTWRLAKVYEEMDKPELAWLYADAYLRLSPSDKKAQDLRNAMTTAVPKGFKLPKNRVEVVKVKPTKVVQKITTIKEIKVLMRKGQWLKAKREALKLRKQGEPKADALLEKINVKVVDLAEKYYQDGNLAFRSEEIDDAVTFWQKAVELNPNEQIYQDSLRRGKQIQERLNALKTEGDE